LVAVAQQSFAFGQRETKRFYRQLFFGDIHHFATFLYPILPHADYFNMEIHRHHLRCCINAGSRSLASLRLNCVGVRGPVHASRSSTLFHPVVTASSMNYQSMSDSSL
jgi:hypothetical protein